MDDETLLKLKNVIEESTCPRGCGCRNARLEDLCKARRAGLDTLLECLEDEPENCTFSMSFGGSYFCKCSTRMEIAKLLSE